jgi:hypothetical protein
MRYASIHFLPRLLLLKINNHMYPSESDSQLYGTLQPRFWHLAGCQTFKLDTRKQSAINFCNWQDAAIQIRTLTAIPQSAIRPISDSVYFLIADTSGEWMEACCNQSNCLSSSSIRVIGGRHCVPWHSHAVVLSPRGLSSNSGRSVTLSFNAIVITSGI